MSAGKHGDPCSFCYAAYHRPELLNSSTGLEQKSFGLRYARKTAQILPNHFPADMGIHFRRDLYIL